MSETFNFNINTNINNTDVCSNAHQPPQATCLILIKLIGGVRFALLTVVGYEQFQTTFCIAIAPHIDCDPAKNPEVS